MRISSADHVYGRYLSEDVPGVVAPIMRIAEKEGLETLS